MAILNLSNYTKCQFKSVLSMEDERNRCMEQRFSLYIRYIYIYYDDIMMMSMMSMYDVI